jgi:hypothetical protein
MRFDDGRCRSTQQQHISSSSSSSSYEQLSSSLLPKFQTVYADIEDRRRKRRILTFDIEKTDSYCITLQLKTASVLLVKDNIQTQFL